MGWSTSISWVDADQNESHLATWHGPELYGFRSDRSGEWVGNLAEEAVLSAEYRNGFPDRYEVTVQGTVDGLKRIFSETYREHAKTDHLYTDADGLERQLRALPEGARVRIVNWDQS